MMIIPVRYHIFTIIAIFLALGFGILIGSSFVNNEKMAERQKAIISGIDRDIKKIKNINSELNLELMKLKKEIEKKKEIEVKYLESSMKNKLKGETYYILTENIKQDNNKLLKKIFASAGADIKIIDSLKSLTIEEKDKIVIWNKKDFTTDNIDDNTNIKTDNLIMANTDRLMELFMILQGIKP